MNSVGAALGLSTPGASGCVFDAWIIDAWTVVMLSHFVVDGYYHGRQAHTGSRTVNKVLCRHGIFSDIVLEGMFPVLGYHNSCSCFVVRILMNAYRATVPERIRTTVLLWSSVFSCHDYSGKQQRRWTLLWQVGGLITYHHDSQISREHFCLLLSRSGELSINAILLQ